MGAVAPTLFGAIKLLVNNRTAISEGWSISEIAVRVKQFRNRRSDCNRITLPDFEKFEIVIRSAVFGDGCGRHSLMLLNVITPPELADDVRFGPRTVVGASSH